MDEDFEELPECDLIAVNKAIYISSIKALGAFLEASSDSLEQIRVSRLPKDQRQVIISLLLNHIEAVSQITAGLEAAIYTPTNLDFSREIEH